MHSHVNAPEVDLDVHDRWLRELPDVVLVLDSGAHVLWGNERAEEVFGRSLDSSVGLSGIGFVHPDDLELVLRSLESIQRKEIGTFIEVRLRTLTGWTLFEILGSTVGWFADGAVLFSMRDITERRRFEVARDETAAFRTIIHNAAAVTMLLSPDGRIVSSSGALTRVFGHDPEEVEGTLLETLVVRHHAPQLRTALARARQGATATDPVVVELEFRRRGGQPLPIEITIVNLIDDPTVGGFVVTAHDVSARNRAQHRAQESLSLLQATLDSTADGLLVVDGHGAISNFNRRFVHMWRIPETVLSQGDRNLAIAAALDQLVDPESFVPRIEEIYLAAADESEDTLVFKDGRVFERYSRPQYLGTEIVGRVWSFRDVTERYQLESELSFQAFHDPLTGLANNALFKDRLAQAVARTERTKDRIAVFYLDLDNFKAVNDTLGHSAGDQLLRQVAENLSKCIRNFDTAARLGGDEFALIIEDVEQDADAFRLADRILTTLRIPLLIGHKEVRVTASIGIAFGGAGVDGEQLLRNADLAMYMVKERGKDHYEEFRDDMHTAVVERLELAADLRRPSVEDEFILHYQPIVNLESGRIAGFEALVRWQHPTKGLLQPDSFIPFAEDFGLIEKIDRFVLARANAQYLQWKSMGLLGPDALLSVNLSARDLTAAHIDAICAGMPSGWFSESGLILEITESAVMQDPEAAVREIQSLRSFGLHVALDDFGTGYSSLSYLGRFGIDILKIDRSFVAPLSSADEKIGLVHAIVKIAETMGYSLIAEGVESSVQASRLLELGCVLAQGFHLGRPQGARETEALLEDERTRRDGMS